MTMQLAEAISHISSLPGLESFDEATTKQVVVLRILSLLKWDVFRHDEVRPEYASFGKRVDFALCIGTSVKVFLEVKKTGLGLDGSDQQILNYAFQEGVRLAVLTNGTIWRLYLPISEGSWQDRCFSTIDLLKLDSQEAARQLDSFLSRDNVASGAALRNAEAHLTSRKQRQILKNALPATWRALLEQPDELLVELVSEAIEAQIGFRPERTDIEVFLRSQLNGSGMGGQPAARSPQLERTTTPNTQGQQPKKPFAFAPGDVARINYTWGQCIARVSEVLSLPLKKADGRVAQSSDAGVSVCCLVSREYPGPRYWYTLHDRQMRALRSAPKGYVALGCGSSESVLLFPVADFENWLDGLNQATRGALGWHIHIFNDGAALYLGQNNRKSRIDITRYLLQR